MNSMYINSYFMFHLFLNIYSTSVNKSIRLNILMSSFILSSHDAHLLHRHH